ncbi:MAG: four helix bundle protein [Candidatus Pacebacteria bacterium]|nr:four helix bundle protein [Candidatus Paceibacterota bacterium]
MKSTSFQDLIVWQKAMVLVEQVYAYTKGLPKEEVYGITQQIRRSAVSIPSNIAEGKHRVSGKDFKQFLHIAFGSLAELETQLILSDKIYAQVPQSIFDLILEVRKILSVFISKLA